MAVFGTVTSNLVINQAVNVFSNLRNALEAAADFEDWISAYSASDLEAIGFSAADASTILSAAADANELAALYNGGALGSYTLPYNFSASQRAVIGPQ